MGVSESGKRIESLCDALLRVSNRKEMLNFLEDLCTPVELRSLADRWQVAQLLDKGVPYRSIHDRTGVSTATVSRVARALSYGKKGYEQALLHSKEFDK